MKSRAILCALALLVVLTLGTTARAQAVTEHFDLNIPLSTTEFSPCTGEFIFIEGFVHLQSQITETANGTQAEFHLLLNGRGTGLTSGNQYLFHEVSAHTVRFNSQFLPVVETVTITYRLLGVGQVEDFQVKATFHITINPNGQVTVNFDKASMECR